ncbi:MAG TPA: hypothetical protein PK228_19315 [Saprospiraceae bacterium]|nr:hypothetical protein [Saprospiraceae bacterium]
MARIRASVSQASGDDDLVTLGIFPITVSLNPENTTPPTQVPSNISCNLSIAGALAVPPNPATGTRNSQNGIDLQYSVNFNGSTTVGQGYTLSNFQNWNIGDVDGASGSVLVIITEAAARGAVKAPAPEPESSTLSAWDRIILFIRRLFGLKPS